MQRCIIHFGMHKTGSTSIQQTLANSFILPNFYYMSLGSRDHIISNHSNLLSIAFQSNSLKTKAAKITDLNQSQFLHKKTRILNNLSCQLNRKRIKNFIFSAEGLSNWSKKDILNFRNFLDKKKHDYIIVGYIRTPKSFMESAFQERLKSGVLKLDLESSYPNYKQKFEKFGDIFGWDKVQFWLFDSKSFPEGCVVQDFCTRLNIPIQKEKIIISNESLSKEAISLLYAYHLYGPGYGLGEVAMKGGGNHILKDTRKLTKYLSNLKGSKLRLSSSFVQPILSYHQEDIKWMEDKLGSSLGEDLIKDDDTAINTEEDLLEFSSEATYWLAEQLGDKYVKSWHDNMTPQQVANWIHLLRVKLASCNANSFE